MLIMYIDYMYRYSEYSYCSPIKLGLPLHLSIMHWYYLTFCSAHDHVIDNGFYIHKWYYHTLTAFIIVNK